MDKAFEMSEQAIKKAMIAMAKEIDGVAEIKHVSYIEEAGDLVLHVVVNMKMGTSVRSCAENLQKHFISQCHTLLGLRVKRVNIAVHTLV